MPAPMRAGRRRLRFSLSSCLRSDAPDVVDDVPELVRGHLASVTFHAGGLHAVVHDGEDLTVGRAVLPVGIGEVCRFRVELFAHRSVAFPGIAMTSGTLFLIQRL